MALDRIMLEVWNKWVLKLNCREGPWDQDFGNKSIAFEAHKMSTWSCTRYIWIAKKIKNRANIR